MAIQVLNPTQTFYFDTSAGWSRTGGTSVHGVLADSNDSTYVEGSSNNRAVVGGFDFSVIPSTAYISTVTAVIRYLRNPGGAGTGFTWLQQIVDWQTPVHFPWASIQRAAPMLEYREGKLSTSFGPIQNWKPRAEQVNRLGIAFGKNVWAGSSLRVAKAWLEVDYTERPTITNLTVDPSVSQLNTATSFPTVSLSYSHPDNLPIADSVISLYNVDEFGVYQRPTIATFSGSNVAVQLGGVNGLPNGDYAVHARIAVKASDGTLVWSTTSEFIWTQDVVATPTPSIAVVSDPAYPNRVKITVTRGDDWPVNPPFSETYAVSMRFPEIGSDWINFPVMEFHEDFISKTLYFFVPQNTDVEFKANAHREELGYTLGSNDSAVVTYKGGYEGWLLFNGPNYPVELDDWEENNFPYEVCYIDVEMPEGIDFDEHEDQAAFKPQGREDPIIVRDVVRLPEFSLEVGFIGNTEWHKFRRARSSGNTLLLTSPHGEFWFFVVGADTKTKLINTREPYRKVNFVARSVKRPY